jgi:large subunit ribosomal protein L9
MKVILIQNVPGLGKIDDIKEVSEGYGRNFLFAKNLAVPATVRTVSDLEGRRHKKFKDTEAELLQEQELAEKLDGWETSLKEKTTATGALYASVGPQKISEALAKSGFKIDKNQIAMKPIKEIGQHQAKIKFSHGLEVEISVVVSKI